MVAPESYLTGERLGETKHEYLAGVIYAMAGTTVNHDRIAGNIYRELSNQLRGNSCEPFTSDVKVRAESAGALFYYYPDVTVDCSNAQGSSLFAEQPRAIFEVMSPEMARIDRGEKLRNYQALPSLQHYLLVDQFHRFVTVYRKHPDGCWTCVLLEGEASLDLPDLGCRLSLTAIYERTGVR